MRTTWRPYRQGQLDSLCGIYAIVNAVQAVLGSRQAFSQADASELFEVLMRRSSERWGEASVVVEGLGPAEVWHLVGHARRHLRTKGLGLTFDRPFRSAPIRTLPQLVRRLGTLIGPAGSGVIICPLEGRHSHWTVLTGVLPGSLRIADSSRARRYRLSLCCIEGQEPDNPASMRVLEPSGMILVFRSHTTSE